MSDEQVEPTAGPVGSMTTSWPGRGRPRPGIPDSRTPCAGSTRSTRSSSTSILPSSTRSTEPCARRWPTPGKSRPRTAHDPSRPARRRARASRPRPVARAREHAHRRRSRAGRRPRRRQAGDAGRHRPGHRRALDRRTDVGVARRAQAAGRARGLRAAGARGRGASDASTPARPPAASPTCCCDAARAEVCAVDVGYGQLVWSLQTDERVHVYDRTNVRTLQPDDIGGPVELVVADLSFISLTVVMPALTRACVQEGDIVLMIKPQFEVGKEQPRQERRRARPEAARRRGASRLPVRARARLGHPRARAQPAARTGRQRRVLLLAPHRCGRARRRAPPTTSWPPDPLEPRHETDA